MQNRSKKDKSSTNGSAKSTRNPAHPDETPKQKAAPKGKNPAAVALGRLGGLKGGKARAEKLSAQERQDIARKAAEVRWRKNGEQESIHTGSDA